MNKNAHTGGCKAPVVHGAVTALSLRQLLPAAHAGTFSAVNMAMQPATSSGGARPPAPPVMPPQESLEQGQDTHSDSEADMIDEILENYTFTCHPEVRIKLKQELSRCAISLAFSKPWQLRHRLRAVVKPGPDTAMQRWLSKVLLVPTHGLLAVYSTKLPVWFLRLQFVSSYNWITKTPTLDYRITTKWSDGPRIQRKERYHLGKYGLVRCKWNLDLQLPDMEGHLGGPDNHTELMDVDYGRMDFEVTQLDLVLNSPWGNKKPTASSVPVRPKTPDTTTADSVTVEHTLNGQSTAATTSGGTAQPKAQRGAGRQRGKAAPAGASDVEVGVDGVASKLDHMAHVSGGTGEGAGAAGQGKGAAGGAVVGSSLTGAGGVARGKNGSQQEVGVPDWLITFLSKLSVKPPAAHPPGATGQ